METMFNNVIYESDTTTFRIKNKWCMFSSVNRMKCQMFLTIC